MQTLPAHVWGVLSRIDVSAHTEMKQGMTYLSWAWAWGIMCQHFPDFDIDFVWETFPDETVECQCTITIRHEGHVMKRTGWLPVMDNRMKAVPNPNAFLRNTAKMRAMTKTFALAGLGHNIFSNEDLPTGYEPEKIDDKEQQLLHDLIVETGTDLEKFFSAFKIKSLSEMPKERFEKALNLLKKKMEAK